MFSVVLFLLQKTEKRSASRKLVKYWHTNEKKKSTKQFKCEDCVEVGGKKKVYGSENADYKIMHHNYIKHVFKQKSSKRSKKNLNFYTKELKQWKCTS